MGLKLDEGHESVAVLGGVHAGDGVLVLEQLLVGVLQPLAPDSFIVFVFERKRNILS